MSAAFNPKDKIRRFHHVALEVSDMAASINFYCDVFGYQLTEQHEASEVPAIPVELAFLRLGENHHDMVLSTDPNKNYRARDGRDDREGPVAIHHVAWQCESRESWLEMIEHVKNLGLEIVRGPVVHSAWQEGGEGSWGENESFYVLDPDGHKVELFCDMATIADDGVFVSHKGQRIEEAKALEY
jgi:catechol 2,3-dioxygenase-like lactoylglutathione lyase family enzyme